MARDFEPGFNRLLLFLTRPDYVPHRVLPVALSVQAEPRFGITGWYMTRGDSFSAETKRDHDKMRADYSRGEGGGDECM